MSSWLQGFLIERAGRKTLLWKSYTVMALALGLLTVTLSLQVRPHLCTRAVSHLHVLLYGRYHHYFPPLKSLLVGVKVFLGLSSQPCTCTLKAIALYNHDHYLLVRFLEEEETDVCLTLTYLAVINVSNGEG